MQMQKFIISLSFLLLFAGCAHKIDVQQGNIVTLENLNRLKAGMNERQVRFIMGTPMLIDPFHADRWDYYYSMKPGKEPLVSYRATLQFREGHLESIEKHGDIPESSYPEQQITEEKSRFLIFF
jgi:outer membrane protein assembly factor BamE